jgi:hypothetical protein
VGYRLGSFEFGRTFRPESGAVRRVRTFVRGNASDARDGRILSRFVGPGFGMDALWNSFVRMELNFERLRGDARLHDRFFLAPQLQIQPGKVLNRITITGSFGDQVDFQNDRDATGGDLTASMDLRPTDRLRLTSSYRRRWLNVDAGDAGNGRLLTAEIPRIRAVYTFNARTWLRLIGEWSDVTRRPELWTFEVDARSGGFGGSAVFAYKLNWQTVLFLGYADERELDDEEDYLPSERQGFFKISYAFRG